MNNQPSGVNNKMNPYAPQLSHFQQQQQQQQSQQQFQTQQDQYSQQHHPQQQFLKQQPRPSQPQMQSEQNKINPKQVPRPRINIDDFRSQPQIYQTFTVDKQMQKPVPSSQSVYQAVDYGNSNPRYLRMSTCRIGNDPSFIKQSSVPLGAVLHPLVEPHQGQEQIQVINYGEQGPFRCPRCHAYINAFFKFSHAGKKVTCPFCNVLGDVPQNYISSIDQLGIRRDRYQRPQLCKGTYQFVAPANYSSQKTFNPRIVFLLDISAPQILNIIINSIKSSLDNMQSPQNTDIILLTYNSAIQFYLLNADKQDTDPVIVQLADVQEPFIPFPGQKLALNLVKHRKSIQNILDKVLSYAECQENASRPGNCANACIYVASELLNSYQSVGGKIMAFISQPPTNGWGAIKGRLDINLINTDKQKKLLDSDNLKLERLSKAAKEQRICIDQIIISPSNPNYNPQFDLASQSLLTNITGGSLSFYRSFNQQNDSQKLYYQIYRMLTRNQALQITIRARSTIGMTITGLTGGFYTRGAADVQLSAIDEDKSVCVMLKQDGKIANRELVGIQIAMLYTTLQGQRRLRVFNRMIKIDSVIGGIYKFIDGDAVAALLFKDLLSKMIVSSVKKSRQELMTILINILVTYRVQCSNSNQPSHLVLPEGFKKTLLYFNCALKNPAYALLGNCNLDQKIASIHKICTLPCNALLHYLFPFSIEVTDVPKTKFDDQQYEDDYYQNQGANQNPRSGDKAKDFMSRAAFSVIPTSNKYITQQGAYLVNNGLNITLFVGQRCNSNFISSILGANSIEELRQMDRLTEFPELQNRYQQVIKMLIDRQRAQHQGAYLPFKLLVSGDSQSVEFFKSVQSQDSRNPSEFSFVDFLIHVHKLVRSKMK